MIKTYEEFAEKVIQGIQDHNLNPTNSIGTATSLYTNRPQNYWYVNSDDEIDEAFDSYYFVDNPSNFQFGINWDDLSDSDMDIEDTYSEMLELLDIQSDTMAEWYRQYQDCVEWNKYHPYN